MMTMFDALLSELHDQIDSMARLVADGELDDVEARAVAHEATMRQALLLHGSEQDPAKRSHGAMKLVTILEMQRALLDQARRARDVVAEQLRELSRSSVARRAYSRD
jgi:hypothetical protein